MTTSQQPSGAAKPPQQLPLTLAGPAGTTSSVIVEPVVLMTVCDAYIRRNEGQERVIGAVLGKLKDGVMTISTCFAVPHMEQGEVKLDIEHLDTLLKNFKKVFPAQSLVGWFSSSGAVTATDTLLHEFFASKCVKVTDPVYLAVDTTLQHDTLSIKAYIAKSLTLGRQQVAMEFREVPCTVNTTQAERIGMEFLLTDKTDKIPTSMQSLEASISKLQSLVDKTYEYVEAVATGQRKGSTTVGRYIAETISAVPHLSPEDVAVVVGQAQEDVMLVTYLTHMLKAQLSLAEKLGTLQLPLM